MIIPVKDNAAFVAHSMDEFPNKLPFRFDRFRIGAAQGVSGIAGSCCTSYNAVEELVVEVRGNHDYILVTLAFDGVGYTIEVRPRFTPHTLDKSKLQQGS